MAIVRGSCHCGAVRFEAPAPEKAYTCTCSYCDRIGAIWVTVAVEEFKITSMPERIGGYQFGRYVVKHYHCPNCGCAIWTWSPRWSERGEPDVDHPEITYNLRMVHGWDRSGLQIDVFDGESV